MFSSRKTAAPSGGYNLTKSLRFRSSASAYLNRTPSTGNRKTWTWSAWVKRGSSSFNTLFAARQPAPRQYIAFYNNQIYTYGTSSGVDFVECGTTAVFRDFSAWYHIVYVYDTTQATGSNRVKVYVNGVQQTLTFTTTPSQNSDGAINGNWLHYLGSQDSSTPDMDAYLAEVNFVDGQALTPSSFGSTNATTGVWQPAKYTGTYGTNGFYLKFTDTTSTATLGTDYSGNSNTWTVNNISLTTGSTYDSMTDVPTLTSATVANYAVWNPLYVIPSNTATSFTNGNLTFAPTGAEGVGEASAVTTMPLPTTGKWYWEVTPSVVATLGPSRTQIGIMAQAQISFVVGQNSNCFAYTAQGSSFSKVTANTFSSYGASYAANDVIGVAVDLDNGAIYFSKNNTFQNSGVPTSGASKTGAAFTTLTGSSNYFPAVGYWGTYNANFGQQPFAYTPPTGFVALNTYNLPTSTIVKGNTVMDATIFTGDGSSPRSITNTAGFKPDLIWQKARSATWSHILFDSVRGFGNLNGLYSNDTGAEGSYPYGYVSSANSNGYSVTTGSGGGQASNDNATTYVGWQWQAGQGSSSSNTSGSITSTVSVNATAGFSVVTYTGSGAAGTVGHGLGVTPAMIITKKRSNAGGGSAATNWVAWHQSLTGATSNPTGYIYFNDTSAASTTSNFYDGTAMTSSTFRWLTGNDNINYANDTFVSYCWSEIAGFSKFGSYTGNGSTDGTFVYTGFRPKFVMVKCSSNVTSWWIYDSSRNTYNEVDLGLIPNATNADTSGYPLDFLSNGFKFRNSNGDFNGSGRTYIYMAFAENPFKNALAR
jgi:hypothetical protein